MGMVLPHRGPKTMPKLLRIIFAGWIATATLLAPMAPAQAAAARIKDIVDVEGIRENQLVGYGLVVGLDGTGDDMKKKAPFTRESLIGMLERLGVKINRDN